VIHAEKDRRAFARSRSVYRPAIIETAKYSGFCMVKDISPEGAMTETCADLPDGELVRLGFTEQEMLAGKVVWSGAGRLGIQFDRPIDVSAILVGSASDEPNRAPRLPIECIVEIEDSAGSRWEQVSNVSTKGVKIKSSAFRIGQKLSVVIAGMPRKKAVVRWTGEGESGLEFLIPLTYDDLQSWTVEHQSNARAA
jgi:hypothetical protein